MTYLSLSIEIKKWKKLKKYRKEKRFKRTHTLLLVSTIWQTVRPIMEVFPVPNWA